MEALIPLVILVTVAALAKRSDGNSRPTIHSKKHRLANPGVTWDGSRSQVTAPTTDVTERDDKLHVRQVMWVPVLENAAQFPTLRWLDAACEPGRAAFAADPNAALLEPLARELVDERWSEYAWLTGQVDAARFDAVCARLERERKAWQHVAGSFALEDTTSIPRRAGIAVSIDQQTNIRR
jgi:hypothetical protein